ncbi:short-chain dehydrogenase [Limnohabitans sp. Jir61]|uniref:SDR family NAD(P)-dependent oxidoreductase n=1 Tax=Limnohabitans sp. Jir61 TaxID=1826168 RepID=UPI000D38DC5A|nr:SDR family oxidoreductase [Limnohabitans sp. Jir61]PUE32648.1 short-chain dehydrogenase [Limnohabitans sp. Jir61]
MDLQLKGKRALVTGGSRGIGKAVARALAAEGVDVALLARDKAQLALTASELSGLTGRLIIGVCADTGDLDAVKKAVIEAEEALGGGLDILVNAAAEPAGYAKPPGLAEITGEYFHQQLDIKVMGYLRTAQVMAPGMKARGWGRIINISGLAARSTGNAVGSIRNVSVAALTKNLADELGPFGINVTVVHPGLTVTERTAALVTHQAQSRGVNESVVLADFNAGNSTGKVVTAVEVADVVAFLASPKSRAINGDAIPVGGGSPRVIHY